MSFSKLGRQQWRPFRSDLYQERFFVINEGFDQQTVEFSDHIFL